VNTAFGIQCRAECYRVELLSIFYILAYIKVHDTTNPHYLFPFFSTILLVDPKHTRRGVPQCGTLQLLHVRFAERFRGHDVGTLDDDGLVDDVHGQLGGVRGEQPALARALRVHRRHAARRLVVVRPRAAAHAAAVANRVRAAARRSGRTRIRG
jgi:hypothetical protein